MTSMDCLSYLFNYDPPLQLQDCFIPDMDMIIPETDSFFFDCSIPQLQFHQPLVHEAAPFQHFDPFSDQFLPPQDIFLPSPNAEIFNETHDLHFFTPTPKRQKLVDSSYHRNTQNHFHQSHNQNFFDPYGELDLVPEAPIFPEFRVPDFPLTFNVGRGDEDDTKKPTLSSQTISARERRRRIAEKSHELGKLIPGGQKLSTAEMFQAAAMYVKFLQSQVGILQLMKTTKKTKSSINVEMETRVLLASQAIQEKLSSEEVCLVPCDMVRDLTTEETIWRNPKICGEINKLLSKDLPN